MDRLIESLRDREPEVLEPEKMESGSDAMYWIYRQDGSAVKYVDATALEACEFAQELFKMPTFHNPEIFSLLYPRAKLLDLAMLGAQLRFRNLFGGPEYWEQMPEWQRMKRLQEKEKEEKEK